MMDNKYNFCLFASLFLFLIISQQTVSAQTSNNNNLPKELIDYMATREMRYHHFLWHNLRNIWLKLDTKTQNQIKKLGWAPPRPALTRSNSPYKDNNSGEDFLYMHRQLIADANQILSKYSMKVTGFNPIPKPGDTEYPVPRGGYNQDYEQWKTDNFYLTKIKPAEDRLTNPKILKTLTLGQLGSELEFTVHNYLHVRFSNTSSSIRPTSSDAMPYIDKKWDDPKYDSLLDTYSSHVHPVFWKIHGWVDDRIEDWKKANNVTTIQWKGTWLGGPTSSINNLLDTSSSSTSRTLKEMNHNHEEGMQMPSMKHRKHEICVMEKVMRLLLKTDNCFYFNCIAN